MLFGWSMGLAKNVAYPLSPSYSQATRLHPGKARSYESKVLNETVLPMRRKKSLTISHTQHRTPPITTPIQPKRDNGVVRKKKTSHPCPEHQKRSSVIFTKFLFILLK